MSRAINGKRDHILNFKSLENTFAKFNYNATINFCLAQYDNGEYFYPLYPVTAENLFTHSLPHGSSFIKKTFFDRKPYDESYKIAADYEFFVWANKKKAKFHYIQEVLLVFYQTGISSTHVALLDQEKSRVRTKYFNRYQRFIYHPDNRKKLLHYQMVLTHPRYMAGAIHNWLLKIAHLK